MSKCHGCGVILQNENKELLGFTPNLESELCERCFRINHYNDYKRVIKDNNFILEILSKINNKDLVVLIIDIMSIPENLNLIKENLKNNILLVLSKADLLPSEMYEEKFDKIAKSLNVEFVDKILISSNKNYNLDLLMDKINTYKKSNNVYFVGYSNSGKSTLINKIIYNYTNINETITTSLLPSTTLDLIEIKIDEDLTIFDTPGLLEDGNIIDVIDEKSLNKIMPKKKINPRVYQIKNKQVIKIEDIISIMIEPKNDLVFYISNALNITREYEKNIEGREITINANEELVIMGLGFIKFKNKTTIVLNSKYEVNIFTRKSLM